MTGAALGFLVITWAIVFSVAGISLKAILDAEKKKKISNLNYDFFKGFRIARAFDYILT